MHLSRFSKGFWLALVALSSLAQAASPVPALGKPAAYPDWWFERDVIPRLPAYATTVPPLLQWPTHYVLADDYAAANAGQLKYVARCAYDEMRDRLPVSVWATSSGQALYSLVRSWYQDDALTIRQTSGADEYSALNQGQLKYLAIKFYDVLAAVGFTNPVLLPGGRLYPWSTETTDDDSYALVNLGQLKGIFSFRVPGGSGDASDSDTDGLSDAWEFLYWPTLAQTAGTDFDTDGVSNLIEYLQRRNPTKGAISDEVGVVNLRVYSPMP